MNDKTSELRDIFVNVADGDTVTERQEESRGSLAEDEEAIERRLERLVSRMRDAFEFETDLSTAQYCRVVRGFYDGASDAEIAEDVGIARGTVVRARHDLHLLRERETDPPFDLADLRRLLDEGHTVGEAAETLGVAESTVRKYRRVVETRDEIRRVNDRFRSEFAELLTDADLEGHTEAVKRHGLEEAAEDIEADHISF